MSLISSLVPLNLDSEKAKFQANPSYNPQFTYPQEFSDSILTRYGLPQPEFLNLAQNYLDNHPRYQDPLTTITAFLTHEEIKTEITELFGRLKLSPPPIVFEQHRLARMGVNRGQISIRDDIKVDSVTLQKMLAHEVQVHYLRYLNQLQQPFPRLKHSAYLRTEEGLATLIDNFYKPVVSFFGLCRHYLGVKRAQESSFSELFAWRAQSSPADFDSVWISTVRLKRGLKDTSRPGGFTKDLVYLEGLVLILDYLANPAHSLADLYLGKIDISQLPAIKAQAHFAHLVYPEFMADPHRLRDFQAFVHSCRLDLGLAPA